MAKERTVREIDLSDGSTISYQGDELTVNSPAAEVSVSVTVVGADIASVIWLLTGRHSKRRGDAETPTRRSQRQPRPTEGGAA